MNQKKSVRHTIAPKDVPEIDFRSAIDSLARKLKMKKNGALVSLLRQTQFDGVLFRFIYHEPTSWKIYVLCPYCQEKKLKLFKVEGEYACERCHHLSRSYRRKAPRVSAVYSRYIRPIKLLNEIEAQLLNPELNLSLRQRQILENKAATIRKSLPEYAEMIRQEVLAKLSGK